MLEKIRGLNNLMMIIYFRFETRCQKEKPWILDSKGVLRIKGCICVPRVGDLTRLIIKKAQSLGYSIHLGTTKMYCGLKQHYW